MRSDCLNPRQRYFKFCCEVTKPCTEPCWATDNRIALELGNVILRDFSRSSSKERPILIIPPQAGHHSSIADYGPCQSLVQTCLCFSPRVYVTEWRGATPQRKKETIDDCVRSMDACIDAICGEESGVCLIGLCQGGWQSAIYTALNPRKVHSLILAGAPIDFKAGGGKIQFYSDLYPMMFYESMVRMGGGNMCGEYMKTGFKMLNPADRFFLDYSRLYRDMDDPEQLERSSIFRNWYEYTQDLPGAMYLQIVKELFKENRLIKGGLKILGRDVNLRKIGCPLALIAGDRDDITPPEQLFNIQNHVSSKRIAQMTVPAGHIGLFMGKKILKEYWPQILRDFT